MTPSQHPEFDDGRLDRRRFLTLAAGTSGAIALGACSGSEPSGSAAESGATTREGNASPDRAPEPAAPILASGEGRTLVIIEMEGGCDGLDMLIPDLGRYRDLRPTIGLEPDGILELDDTSFIHAGLANSVSLGAAFIEGVGMGDPDLSHFESSKRWWQGDLTGRGTRGTGFLGRLCDELAADEPVTGVSIGRAASPALRSAHAVTLSVPDPYGGGWLLSDDPWMETARNGLASIAASKETGLRDVAGRSLGRALDFLDVIDTLPDRDGVEYPGSDLGRKLETTSRLMAADLGVRVVHVPWGSFDTHDNHRGDFDRQMVELDEALAAFAADLDSLGARNSTLVATASEFGRRPGENAAGTDHGTASTMMVMGPVNAGRHGLAPDLGDLDDDGNLKATVMLDSYYATLAERWFGVDASTILDAPNAALSDLITA